MGRLGFGEAKTVLGRELVTIARLSSNRRIAENFAWRRFNWTPLQEELFRGALKSLCGFCRCSIAINTEKSNCWSRHLSIPSVFFLELSLRKLRRCFAELVQAYLNDEEGEERSAGEGGLEDIVN